MTKILKLIVSVLICQLAGFAGSFFTRTSVDSWYKMLDKPFFNPPSWVFAPVWIILYLVMGISAFLIWNKESENTKVKNALFVFLLQLIINISWSLVFFGMRNILLSVIVIVFLWLSIQWTILRFYKISKIAAFILIPYSCWVSFAAILNIAILYMNS